MEELISLVRDTLTLLRPPTREERVKAPLAPPPVKALPKALPALEETPSAEQVSSLAPEKKAPVVVADFSAMRKAFLAAYPKAKILEAAASDRPAKEKKERWKKQIYPNNLENRHLATTKASSLTDCKSLNISNIKGLTIDRSRELSHGSNADFPSGLGIDQQEALLVFATPCHPLLFDLEQAIHTRLMSTALISVEELLSLEQTKARLIIYEVTLDPALQPVKERFPKAHFLEIPLASSLALDPALKRQLWKRLQDELR